MTVGYTWFIHVRCTSHASDTLISSCPATQTLKDRKAEAESRHKQENLWLKALSCYFHIFGPFFSFCRLISFFVLICYQMVHFSSYLSANPQTAKNLNEKNTAFLVNQLLLLFKKEQNVWVTAVVQKKTEHSVFLKIIPPLFPPPQHTLFFPQSVTDRKLPLTLLYTPLEHLVEIV